VRGRCEARAVQAKVADAPKLEVVAPNPCSFAAHRDATNPLPPLKQVSPSPSPDGCCGGLETTCAPPMSNLDLVPAALFPSLFVGVALRHGVRTGPAKSDAAPVYIFFTVVPSHSLAHLHPPPHHRLQEREVSTEALSCCGAWPSSRGRVRAL
jgi:hypothetical protein